MTVHTAESSGEATRQELTRCQSELAALRAQADAWHCIFVNAPVALSLAATDGRLREVNTRYAQLMGQTREQLSGRLLSELHMLPAHGSTAQSGTDTGEHASVEWVANHYQRGDGALQPSITSLQLVETGAETLILSSTLPAPDADAAERVLLAARADRVDELEALVATHRAQEQRLIGEIGGLCGEASLLKSDIIRLKQMQQALSSEMDALRKHALSAERAAAPAPAHGPATSDSSTPVPLTADAPAARSAAAAPSAAGDGGPGEALWEVAATRLQHVEEQLIRHVAALREQAARMQTVAGEA